jgi:hypothetical protein
MKMTFWWANLTATQAEGNSQTNGPAHTVEFSIVHTIEFSIVTDLIFRESRGNAGED